jgi:hypothetical protein
MRKRIGWIILKILEIYETKRKCGKIMGKFCQIWSLSSLIKFLGIQINWLVSWDCFSRSRFSFIEGNLDEKSRFCFEINGKRLWENFKKILLIFFDIFFFTSHKEEESHSLGYENQTFWAYSMDQRLWFCCCRELWTFEIALNLWRNIPTAPSSLSTNRNRFKPSPKLIKRFN